MAKRRDSGRPDRRHRRQHERTARLRGPDAAPEVELLVEPARWGLDLDEACRAPEVDSPASLQQVLVIPTPMNSQVPEGVVEAVSRVHTAYRDGLVETVLLAATHAGWRDGGRALIQGVEGSGVLDADATRRIAQALMADRVGFDIPGEWAAELPVLQLTGRPRLTTVGKTVTARRRISTQLRRWASSRCLVDSQDVAALATRAREFDSRHGAAVVLGMLDATEQLDEGVAAETLHVAVEWTTPSVRLAAVKQLIAAGGHDETVARIAEHDPASTVRQWAAKHQHDHEKALF
jgi:hypothetical protein